VGEDIPIVEALVVLHVPALNLATTYTSNAEQDTRRDGGN
jgi:hypothetical protein